MRNISAAHTDIEIANFAMMAGTPKRRSRSAHWQDMDRDTRIRSFQSIYQPGMSARDIAAHFPGATRQAVIGLYFRKPDKLAGCPLLKPCQRGPQLDSQRPAPKRKPKKKKQQPVSNRIDIAAPRPLRLTMAKLDPGQCKFPVNNAAEGEPHLFCGHRAEGPYCPHHRAVAFIAETPHAFGQQIACTLLRHAAMLAGVKAERSRFQSLGICFSSLIRARARTTAFCLSQ